MVNRTEMAHPVDLHGHPFQVVAIGERRFAGAVRDTVLVPPKATVTVAFDAAQSRLVAFALPSFCTTSTQACSRLFATAEPIVATSTLLFIPQDATDDDALAPSRPSNPCRRVASR